MAHGHHVDRLVQLRIEALVLRLQSLHAEAKQHAEKLVAYEPHALDDRWRITGLVSRSDRSIEIVEYRHEIEHELFAQLLRRRLSIALHSRFRRFEIAERARQRRTIGRRGLGSAIALLHGFCHVELGFRRRVEALESILHRVSSDVTTYKVRAY